MPLQKPFGGLAVPLGSFLVAVALSVMTSGTASYALLRPAQHMTGDGGGGCEWEYTLRTAWSHAEDSEIIFDRTPGPGGLNGVRFSDFLFLEEQATGQVPCPCDSTRARSTRFTATPMSSTASREPPRRLPSKASSLSRRAGAR